MIHNIFHDLPDASAGEVFEALLNRGGVRVERIVSEGQSTPQGEWLSQPEEEWVILLKGSAALEFEGEKKQTVLTPGDYIHIPANTRHRVAWTDREVSSVWLAVHVE